MSKVKVKIKVMCPNTIRSPGLLSEYFLQLNNAKRCLSAA